MNEPQRPAPLRILILALGGEGGGVLMNWIVSAARATGHAVQATSVPGVAQRTGSTSYYVEVAQPGSDAVLGLVPMAGRVDVVVASELVEAARAMELGFVSDRLTTLIASTNRVYSTAEKVAMADGRYDGERIMSAAKAMAKTCHLLDLDEIARENGTFISATMYGALAGSDVLPWPREASEAAIGTGARASASLRGFRDAAAKIAAPGPLPEATQRPPVADLAQIPEGVRAVVALGCERACDHQDGAYADLYVARVERILAAADVDDHTAMAAVSEACRRLALWMAYEDVPRVADLKTRPERFARIRAEAKVEPGQLLKVTEYLKPRAEEVADMLPVAWGERLMARVKRGKSIPLGGRGLRLRSNGVAGFLVLRALAAMRRIRRKSLRYQREQEAIEAWLDRLVAALPRSPAFAEALAALPHLRKGYSDTLARGLRAYDRVMAEVVDPALAAGTLDDHAARLRGAMAAALADDKHERLDAFLAGVPATAKPLVPVHRIPQSTEA